MLPTKEASVHVGSDKSWTPGHIYAYQTQAATKNLSCLSSVSHAPPDSTCFLFTPWYTSNTRDETIVERPGQCFALTMACFALLARGARPQSSTQLLHLPHLRQYLHLCTSKASKVSSVMSRRCTIDYDVLGGRGGRPQCCSQLLHLPHHTHRGLHRSCPQPHVKQRRVRLARLY